MSEKDKPNNDAPKGVQGPEPSRQETHYVPTTPEPPAPLKYKDKITWRHIARLVFTVVKWIVIVIVVLVVVSQLGMACDRFIDEGGHDGTVHTIMMTLAAVYFGFKFLTRIVLH